MKKLLLFAAAFAFTACQSTAPAPATAQKPRPAASVATPGTMRAAPQRGEIRTDAACTMKKQDFSAADRTGLTMVYFSKAVCDACAQQAPAWDFAAAHVPEGAKMKKVFENAVDLDWYGVMTHPTFILFRDGREVWRYVGIAAAYQLTDAIKRNSYR